MRDSRQLLRSSALVAALSAAMAAQADITITLTPQPGGTVQAVGTGSGTISGTHTSADWDYNDFSGNFLLPGQEAANTEIVTGNFTNVTTGITYDLQSFQLDEDGGNAPGDDDIDIDTLIDAVFTAGDLFTFTMTAEWPLVTSGDNEALPASGLRLGVFTSPGGGGAGAENIFGTATIIVVPEPGALGLGLIAAAALAARRRRSA